MRKNTFWLILIILNLLILISCGGGGDSTTSNGGPPYTLQAGMNRTVLNVEKTFDFSSGTVVSSGGDMTYKSSSSGMFTTSAGRGPMVSGNHGSSWDDFLYYVQTATFVPDSEDWWSSEGVYTNSGSFDMRDYATRWVETVEGRLACLYIEEADDTSMTMVWVYPYSQTDSACTDTDGDGYFQESGCGTSVDCNDHASNIYPGAPELCDGFDNQCSGDTGYGEIDEGCTIDINSYAGTYTGTITIDSASPEASADESLLGSYRCTVVIGNPTHAIDEQYLCSISATRVIGGGTPSTSYGTLYEDGTFVGTVSINPNLTVSGTVYGDGTMSLNYIEQYNGAMYSVYAATLTKQ